MSDCKAMAGAVASGAIVSTEVAQKIGLPSAAAMVTVLSHDLRNPLNALSGWLQIMALDDARFSGSVRRALRGAQAAVAEQVRQVASMTRLLHAYHGYECADQQAMDLLPMLMQLVALWQQQRACATQSVSGPMHGLPSTVYVMGEPIALMQAMAVLGRYGLHQASDHACLQVHLLGGEQLCVRLSLDADPSAPAAWAVLQGSGERMTMELLEALAVLQTMGVEVRLRRTPAGCESLDLIWTRGVCLVPPPV